MAFRDLQSRRLIILKGWMFLFTGLGSAAVVVLEGHTWWKCLIALCICIWAFCRAYYFAFYVLQHYVDPTYRYAGLWSAVRYLITTRPGRRPGSSDQTRTRD